MKLRNVELNLLVLLHALLEERHVSRAAKPVGPSQPAMSNALVRQAPAFHQKVANHHQLAFDVGCAGWLPFVV